MQELEEATGDVPAPGTEGAAPTGKAPNRAEKKARKAMQKLGMKQLTGFHRVTVKKSKNILFVIQNPDVFKSHASDTYVIFGEAKIEDLSAQAQAQAAEQFKAPAEANLVPEEEASAVQEIDEDKDDDEEVSADGLDETDIEMAMSQASVSRSKAIKALRKTDGDLVSAILELTN